MRASVASETIPLNAPVRDCALQKSGANPRNRQPPHRRMRPHFLLQHDPLRSLRKNLASCRDESSHTNVSIDKHKNIAGSGCMTENAICGKTRDVTRGERFLSSCNAYLRRRLIRFWPNEAAYDFAYRWRSLLDPLPQCCQPVAEVTLGVAQERSGADRNGCFHLGGGFGGELGILIDHGGAPSLADGVLIPTVTG